jgi:thioredoxin reductase
MSDDYDALIVGGGPAGLGAALILGRCLRKVLVCDTGQQRNRKSHGIHGLPGHEGCSPQDYLESLREELNKYPTIHYRRSAVTEIARTGTSFEFCADGRREKAKKVLLATGLVDKLPDWPMIDEYYGQSIHHCLYCDGAEYAGKSLLAYGESDKGAGLALMMRHWSEDVALCSANLLPSVEMQARLAIHNIPIINTEVSELIGTDGHLRSVRFANGETRRCLAIFFSTGCAQGSNFATDLGCRRDGEGKIITDPKTEETTASGIYVAGDASRDVLLIAVAVGEGIKAGVAINRALLTEAGLL